MNRLIILTTGLLFMIEFGCVNQTSETKDNSASVLTLDALNAQIISDSTNPDYYLSRAVYLLNENKATEALSDLNLALKYGGEKTEVFVRMADAYLQLSQLVNCRSALNKAIRLDPGNVDALMKSTELYYLLGDYEAANKQVAALIKEDEQKAEAYLLASMIALETQDAEAAKKWLQALLHIDPENYEAHFQLGNLLTDEEPMLAEQHLTSAVSIRPDDTEASYALAMLYQKINAFAEAEQVYEKILEINPEHIYSLYNLGYMYLVYQEDAPKSIDYFMTVVRLRPDYVDAVYNLGRAYEFMGENEQARSYYLKSLEMSTNYELAIEGLNRLDNLQE